jgi:hypothetical protein
MQSRIRPRRSNNDNSSLLRYLCIESVFSSAPLLFPASSADRFYRQLCDPVSCLSSAFSVFDGDVRARTKVEKDNPVTMPIKNTIRIMVGCSYAEQTRILFADCPSGSPPAACYHSLVSPVVNMFSPTLRIADESFRQIQSERVRKTQLPLSGIDPSLGTQFHGVWFHPSSGKARS